MSKKVYSFPNWRGARMGIAAAVSLALANSVAFAGSVNTQAAQLFELQAEFHGAATVHDPLNGDSAPVIDQRIRDMLALWTSDGSITLEVGGAKDGNYAGQGDPSDPTSCPTPSADPSNRGTVCTFFKYVAGSFQAANKFVSLAPSYKTNFSIHGNDASVYFECHYFNVAVDPMTGQPLWKAVSHVTFDGTAQKIDGTWLFLHSDARVVGVPVP